MALAAITIVWALAASRWLITDTVVPWDSKNQSFAFFRFLASALHSDSTPFWNPFHYGGHPSVADPQSLIFAPVFVAWAWFDAEPSMRVFDLLVYVHLLLGGLALGGLGWRMGWPVPAIVLAAAVFMLGGPAAGRLTHTSMMVSYGLFPLAMLLLSLALGRRSVAFGILFGVVASVLTLQRTHVTLLLCFVLAAVFVRELWVASRWRWLREQWLVLAAIAVVSVLLLAVPLLLTIQFAALSNRPVASLDAALEASLYPVNLASMAVANVLGSLETQSYWGPNYETLPEVAATDRSFNYLFVGATTVLILLWLGIAGGGLMRRGRRLLTAVLLVALAYTLGRYTPLYAFAFAHVPGVDLFRRPIDGVFVVVAMLAVLCGHLLTDYVREGLPRPGWPMLAVAAAGLGVIVWAVVFAARSGHGWDASREVVKAVAIIAAAAAVLWWGSRHTGQARNVAAACVAVLAVGELVWWNAASSLNAEAPNYYSVLERPSGEDAAALALLKREIDARHAVGDRPRIEVVGVSGPWQNVAMTQELEATNGYNPLRIGWYDRLVSPGETTYTVDQRRFPSSFDNYDCALARELGLEYLVLGRPIDQIPHLARRPIADTLLAGPDIWIYRLADPEPRVRFIAGVVVGNADAEVRAGKFGVNPAVDTAVIDIDTAPLRRYVPAMAVRGGNYAHIIAWQPDRIEVEVDSLQPGVLVLHDPFYPGWTAEVDGRPTRVLRANVLFRGVEVSEGRHRVVFRFQPFSFANLGDALRDLLHGHR